MTEIVHGLLEKKESGWSYRIGNKQDHQTWCEGLPDIETAYNKMLEAKINPDAKLIAMVKTKLGKVEYELYKTVV